MKRIVVVLFLVVLVASLAGCGQKRLEIVTNGEFAVTPQEFVDSWNGIVEDFKAKTKDAESILLLPAFEESKKEMKMGKSLNVIYILDENTGKLKEIKISWYYPTATKEEIITASFMASGLPTFLNPKTEIDLNEKFDMSPDTKLEAGNVSDNGIIYSYSSVETACSLTIKSVRSFNTSKESSSASEASSAVESSSSAASASSVDESGSFTSSSFDFSADDFVSVMDERLKGSGYKTIADSPVEITDSEIEHVGAVTLRTYEVAKGFSLQLIERKEDKKLNQIMCIIDETDLENAELWGYFKITLLYKVDPDGYKSVMEQLDLADAKDEEHVNATGVTASFTYMVSDETEILLAYPNTL